MSSRPVASLSDQIPELKAYLERVGAEEVNFRRFVVREPVGNGYTREVASIRLSSDGDLKCSREQDEPTKDEALTILKAYNKIELPKEIGASEAQLSKLKRQLKQSDDIYAAVARHDGLYRMVQQRIDKPDGRKAYIPWTYWSDGNWRAMEPEGPLPFWKPRESRKKKLYMVHEGAKAAAFVDDLVNNPARREELAKHPWAEDLMQFEHWGLLTGAGSPHRADYEELRRENPKLVIYACDRDDEGEGVLQIFSRCYRGRLQGTMFGEEFRASFDLADPIPQHLFDGGKFRGPSFASLLRPATWATDLIGDKPILRRLFSREWMHATTPSVFIHADFPDRVLNREQFNDAVRPFSHSKDTASLAVQDAARKAETLGYSPARRYGFQPSENGRYINTHRPSTIRSVQGDAAPFIEFMEHLIPEPQERLEVLRWCATLIARPDIRMRYALLLISETQGVGKTTLARVLAALVGASNVSYPSNKDLESQFTYWVAHKRLAIVHEIYAGRTDKVYNELKSKITEDDFDTEHKYQAPYRVENWLHVFASSNSDKALLIPNEDRRWFIPSVAEDKWEPEKWDALNRWLKLEDGLGIIRRWAETFVEEHRPDSTGASAPPSKAKQAMVEENWSRGQQLAAEVLDYIGEVLDGIDPQSERLCAQWEKDGMLVVDEKTRAKELFVMDQAIVDLVRDVVHQGRTDRLEKPRTIRSIAKAKGWHVGPRENRTRINAKWGSRATVMSRTARVARAKPEALYQQGRKPLDLGPLAEKLIKM